MKTTRRTHDYVMGSADPELRRLRTISVLYRDTTRRWLEHAGIGPGMPVVDVGCGPGDVTLLAAVFREAGLPEPGLISGQPAERGPEASGYSIMAGDVISLLPLMERLGTAGATEVGPESFERRLREEAAAVDAVLLSPLMVGAWARVP